MSTTLPLLYKLTTTGKIQTWTIEFVNSTFRTHSGVLKGKVVTSAWTMCAGKNLEKKNATSPEAQAEKEARAKWAIKKQNNYFESVEDAKNPDFKEPMLAKDYDDVAPTYPCYTQPKLDGIRCIVTRDGMFSRHWKPIVAAPHITEKFAPIFKKYPDLAFDGELYSHAFKEDFDGLTSLIRPSKPTAEELQTSREELQYWVFDIQITTKPFSDRLILLEEIMDQLNLAEVQEMVILTPTQLAENKAELDEQFAEAVELGFEGLMLRADTPYAFGRTENLLKRKDMKTDEFEIVDITEGKGNRAGMAGKVVLKLHKPTTDGKTTCEANPKGNKKFYIKLLKDRKKVIGKMAQTEFQNYTPKGSLRFARVLTIRDYE